MDFVDIYRAGGVAALSEQEVTRHLVKGDEHPFAYLTYVIIAYLFTFSRPRSRHICTWETPRSQTQILRRSHLTTMRSNGRISRRLRLSNDTEAETDYDDKTVSVVSSGRDSC